MNTTSDTKERLQQAHAEIATMFHKGSRGMDMARHLCRAVDRLLIDLWQQSISGETQEIDVLAVGGYGRGELAPHSDWDLWLLLPCTPSEHVKTDIQRFLYVLWDMKVDIGYATRTVSETIAAIREDTDTATAGSEVRLLTGSGIQFAQLQNKTSRFFKKEHKTFVQAKLAEFDVRRRKMGGTAFLMEPDIKEGKGGLRDIQSVFWMARAWHQVANIAELVDDGMLSASEYRQLVRAQGFLWRCRIGIHLSSKRATNCLNFEMQAKLAQEMGYQSLHGRADVEQFMKHYFRHVGRVAHIADFLVMYFKEQTAPFHLTLRKKLGDGFILRGKWLDVCHDQVFAEDPLRLLRIFHVGQQDHRRLSSRLLRLIREESKRIDRSFRSNREANDIFLSILRNPRNVGWALKEMNDTGILGRFIPDMGRAEGLGQFDRYHAYTVDEHTIRTIRQARRLRMKENDEDSIPWAHEVMESIQRPELLYLALLFHDLAKGRDGDHSEMGEKLARRFCHRLGLNEDANHLVCWLVRHHLLMAWLSQRSDLADPEVIRGFMNRVADKTHLDYLLLLTIADIRAVGPNIWNDWKGSLLRTLYHATKRMIMGEEVDSHELQQNVDIRLKSTIKLAEIAEKRTLRKIFTQLPNRCVMHFPPVQLIHIGRLLANATQGNAVRVITDESRGETSVLVLNNDQQGLFARLATTIACGHINIVAAQAYAMRDGRILDVFYVHADGKPIRIAGDLERLEERIWGEIEAGDTQDQHIPDVTINTLMRRVPVRVRHIPFASSRQTAIEISAADRPGLLARLAQTVADAGFDVRGANISTFGERVVDVFFLADKDGAPLAQCDIDHIQVLLKDVAALSKENTA